MTASESVPNDNSVTFGKDLREELRKKNISGNAASRELGTAQSTVAQWLNGNRLMSRDDLIRVVRLFQGDEQTWVDRWEVLDTAKRERFMRTRRKPAPRPETLEDRIKNALAGFENLPSGTVVRVNFEFVVP